MTTSASSSSTTTPITTSTNTGTQRSRSHTTTRQSVKTTKGSTVRSTITTTIPTQRTTTTDSNLDYYDIPTIDDGNQVDTLIQRRIKRSFVSYLLSLMTGLAEENELEDMRRFEKELLERENSLGNTFGNLTVQDEELTKQIQEISEKV